MTGCNEQISFSDGLDTFVFLESTMCLADLSDLHSGCEFGGFDSFECNQDLKSRIIVVGENAEWYERAFNDFSSPLRIIEFRFSKDQLSTVIDLIRALPEIAVSHVDYRNKTFVFQVSCGAKDSPQLKDFLLGLEMHRKSEVWDEKARLKQLAVSQSATEGNQSKESWRAKAIARAIPYAKPIKRFLPSKVVALIYKVLNAVRA